MAIFPNSVLRDMSQNNIDFVAKQMGRLLDAIYGEQAQATDTIPGPPPLITKSPRSL